MGRAPLGGPRRGSAARRASHVTASDVDLAHLGRLLPSCPRPRSQVGSAWQSPKNAQRTQPRSGSPRLGRDLPGRDLPGVLINRRAVPASQLVLTYAGTQGRPAHGNECDLGPRSTRRHVRRRHTSLVSSRSAPQPCRPVCNEPSISLPGRVQRNTTQLESETVSVWKRQTVIHGALA
jgi:hypothetical protein